MEAERLYTKQPSRTIQQKRGESGANKAIIQKRMESDANRMTWNPFGGIVNTALFNSLPEPHVLINKLTKTSKPVAFEEMKDTDISKLIKDPSRSYRQMLTKMHMIRGVFGGPGTLDNIRLGTAKSNNGGSGSHTYEVEYPIENFLKSGSTGIKRFVDYTVSINDGSIPQYLQNSMNNSNTAIRNKQRSFLDKWCPTSFLCEATFYEYSNTPTFIGHHYRVSNPQKETIRLDQI